MSDAALLDGLGEELRDFLAADLLDVPVDPAFKERLREELWDLVSANVRKWRVKVRSRKDGDS